MRDTLFEERTLAARVTDKLRDDIINNTFETGSRITIKDVSQRYGVSPMPVREAFRILEGEKLLSVNAYKGATVLRIDGSFIRDVYGILRALECLIYESAMVRLDSTALRELREINAQIRHCADSEEATRDYIALNTRFHNAILKYGSNQLALEQYRSYQQLIRTLRKRYSPGLTRVQAVYTQHESLIDALEIKDIAALKIAVDIHVNGAMENFLNQLNQQN